MSLRPPSTFQIAIAGPGAGNSSAPAPTAPAVTPAGFTLVAAVDSPVPGAFGSSLALMGVYFPKAADGLTFISSGSTLPPGVGAPNNITRTISAPCFLEITPASINASSTAPFELWYGPLGPGGR